MRDHFVRKDMANFFKCATCGSAITRAVSLLSKTSLLVQTDGQPHIAQGYYVVSDGKFYTGTKGSFIVNLEDAVNTKHHHLRSRLNGCCGLDGCDGLNTLCENGHEIGTEKSDCWMPHALILDPKAVKQVMVNK